MTLAESLIQEEAMTKLRKKYQPKKRYKVVQGTAIRKFLGSIPSQDELVQKVK